jgi:hypothetical protein
MTETEGAFSGVLGFCQRRCEYPLMYIIAIAWLYVTVLMAASESSVTAAIATFLFYGLFPLGILLYLMGTPQRRRARLAREQSSQEMTHVATDESPQRGAVVDESQVQKTQSSSTMAQNSNLTAQARSGKPADL